MSLSTDTPATTGCSFASLAGGPVYLVVLHGRLPLRWREDLGERKSSSSPVLMYRAWLPVAFRTVLATACGLLGVSDTDYPSAPATLEGPKLLCLYVLGMLAGLLCSVLSSAIMKASVLDSSQPQRE